MKTADISSNIICSIYGLRSEETRAGNVHLTPKTFINALKLETGFERSKFEVFYYEWDQKKLRWIDDCKIFQQ